MARSAMDIITETPELSPHESSMHISNTSNTSISMSSPVASVFSRGHSSKGSASSSSLASSPLLRDSFDLYASRLGKVTEEPREKDGTAPYMLDDDGIEGGRNQQALMRFVYWTNSFLDDAYDRYFSSTPIYASPTASPILPDYSFGDQDEWGTASDQRRFKRQRSSEQKSSSVSTRLSTRFNSISRRWRNRSGAVPQLSIVTHVSAPVSRSASAASSQIMSPALAAISARESYLPPSPARTALEDSTHGSDALSIPEAPFQEAPGIATTPLLPPVFTELAMKESPIHSPLQSPSIAPTQTFRPSMDVPPTSSLPSPPLSTKPSLVSIRQRSRANTATAPPLAEIPPLQMLDDHEDFWASRLGHADFSIHPEPYLPGVVDLASYTEFRANWDQARTNYAKHLARTIEHYGSTSKVFKLTEDKWSSVDQAWKGHDYALTRMLAPILARASENDTDMMDAPSGAMLEKPVTRIIVPAIDDKSGKFPELGDGEIVGPMSVVPPRSASMRKSSPPLRLPASPRKRNLLKFLQDMFART
jgi:hypothetical protein